jgi:hypothetical protein
MSCRRCGHEWETWAAGGQSLKCPGCRASEWLPAGRSAGGVAVRRSRGAAGGRGRVGGVSRGTPRRPVSAPRPRDEPPPTYAPRGVSAGSGPSAAEVLSEFLVGTFGEWQAGKRRPGGAGVVQGPAVVVPAARSAPLALSRPPVSVPARSVSLGRRPAVAAGSPYAVVGDVDRLLVGGYGLPPTMSDGSVTGCVMARTPFGGGRPTACTETSLVVVELGAGSARIPACPSHVHQLLSRHKDRPTLPRPRAHSIHAGAGYGFPVEYVGLPFYEWWHATGVT